MTSINYWFQPGFTPLNIKDTFKVSMSFYLVTEHQKKVDPTDEDNRH